MSYTYSFGRPLARYLVPALAGLALLLAPAGPARAQTPASFAALATYPTGGSLSLRVVTGDLNGDGRLDAVTANITSNNVSVFLGNSNGTFGAATLYTVAPTNVQVQGVTLGDVNGDGRLDIVTGNNGNSTIGVLLGLSSGGFAPFVTYTTGANTEPRNVALADINGDGRLDAVTGNSASPSVSVLLGQANGTFGTPTQYATSGLNFDVALGDVNGDGRLDIVAPTYSTNSVNVLLGQTGGTFGAFTSYPTGTNSQSVSVRLGDVNLDGRLDIVVGNQNATVSVLLGQAGGTLATPVNYSTGSVSTIYAVGIGDVNGDGRPDIVAGNFQSANIVILLGQAGGGFTTSTAYNGGSGSQGVALADVNVDGRLDILTANRNDNTLGVLLNTSNFTAPSLATLNPANGPVGTSVTITGAGLSGITGVSFNGTAATTFSTGTGTSATATVPTGATTGNVVVTTSGGVSNGLSFAVNPTVVIASSAGASGSSTTATPIPFTITFSQNVTGFVSGDISVTNGTVTSISVSGNTYSITVTPTTAGTATTVSVPANVAQAAAGTGNVAAPAYSLTYNAPVTATTWTGAVSANWYANGNWTNGMPGRRIDALIPGNVTTYPVVPNGTAYAKNLTLASGATLTQIGGTLELRGNFSNSGNFVATGGTVSLRDSLASQLIGGLSRTTLWNLIVGTAGASLDGAVDIQRVLTLNGNLSTVSLGLTLLSSSTGTAMVVNSGGVVSGQATVQRYINPSLNAGLGYRHYSSPTQSATVGSLATAGFTPVVNSDYNTLGNTATPFPTVFGFDESRITGASATTQDFEYGYFSPNSLSEPLTPGRGYTVNINASEKVALTGALTTGTVAVGALSRGLEANSGWQLLGNPYPAPLDWNVARQSLPTGVIDAIYVYKSSDQYNGSYQFYQNGFGTLPGGLVPSMQGFFLRVSQPVASFSFLNAWRATAYQDPTFNRPTADTRPSVQLDLVSAQGVHDPAFVYFENGATAGLDDHYDAEKLPNTTGLNLASVAAGTGLAVNGLPLQNATTTVPLTVGVPVTGTYTLRAEALLNLGTTDVYLHDAVTGQNVNLKQQPSYTFSAANAALSSGRFTLSFGPMRPTATKAGFTAASVSLYPNPAHKQFTLLVPAVSGESQAQLTLYNVLGQPVRTATLALPATGAQTSMDVQGLPEGVYVLRVQAGTTTITKQVVVN